MKNISLALAAVALLAGTGAYAQDGFTVTGPGVVVDTKVIPVAPACNTRAGYRLPGTGMFSRLFHHNGPWFSAGMMNYGVNVGGNSAKVVSPNVSYNGMQTLTYSALIGGATTNRVLVTPAPAPGFDQAGSVQPMADLDFFGKRLIRFGGYVPSDMDMRQ